MQSILAGVVALATLAGAVPADAQAFRPARPPANLGPLGPGDKAHQPLRYCTEVHMVAWYNAMRAQFSDALLEKAAALAVSNCDHLVDAATRETIAVVRQMVANPAATGRAFAQIGIGNGEPMPVDKLKVALANKSYAEWRASEVEKARLGAMMYIRGVQIATSPGKPDSARSGGAE